jgi:hypothetical protein
MSKRLDFGQDLRNRQARHGLNVKDEAEWMKNDAAANWLRKGDYRLSAQQSACSGTTLRPRKRLKQPR